MDSPKLRELALGNPCPEGPFGTWSLLDNSNFDVGPKYIRRVPMQLTVAYWLPLACLLCMNNALWGKEYSTDSGTRDTVIIESSTTYFPNPGVTNVVLVNDEPLAAVEVTLIIKSPLIQLDSVSFKGSRFYGSGIGWQQLVPSIATIYLIPGSGDMLSPGRGLLGRLYCSYPQTMTPQSVRVDTTTWSAYPVEHTTFCADSMSLAFPPIVQPGLLTILPPCCVEIRGNVDGSTDQVIDISDLSWLISHLFLEPDVPLSCPEEADLDSPPNMNIDISDLTVLIDYLYIHPDSVQLPACF